MQNTLNLLSQKLYTKIFRDWIRKKLNEIIITFQGLKSNDLEIKPANRSYKFWFSFGDRYLVLMIDLLAAAEFVLLLFIPCLL